MIIEAYSIFRSIFPFIKEVFLWRDGAQAGKPVTRLQLWRRQLATYLMTISLALNYFAFTKLYKMGGQVITLKKEIATLHIHLDQSPAHLIAPTVTAAHTPENNMSDSKTPHTNQAGH